MSSWNIGFSIDTVHVAMRCAQSSTARATGGAFSNRSPVPLRLREARACLILKRRVALCRVQQHRTWCEPIQTLIEKTNKQVDAVTDQDIAAGAGSPTQRGSDIDSIICAAIGQAVRQPKAGNLGVDKTS